MYISINGGRSSKSYVNACDHPEMVVFFVFFRYFSDFSPLSRGDLWGRCHLATAAEQVGWAAAFPAEDADRLANASWAIFGRSLGPTGGDYHGNRHYNLEPSLIFFDSGVFIPYYTPIWDDFKSPPNGALMGWLWIIGRPTWPALRPQHGAEDEELRAQAPAPLPQLVRMMGMGWASMERSLMGNLYV